MTETKNLIVRGVPPRLKGKIARRAEREKSSLNDVVVSVLAAAFAVEFQPSGNRSPRLRAGEAASRVGPYPNMVLRVPAELKRRIDYEAIETDETVRNVVVRILADEFGETFVPTGRWIDRESAATA